MSITYHLSSHQKYPQLRFACVEGKHYCDFAPHRHDFSELFLVVSGSAKHTVAGFEYPISKGDVFVINGDIEHGFCDVDQLKVINLMFDPAAPFFERTSMRQLSGYQAMFKVEPVARQTSDFRAKLTLGGTQLPGIVRLIDEIKQEYEQGLPGFEVMLTSLMQQLVVALARLYQTQDQELPQTTLALSRALIHIEQNLTQTDISSESIARAAYVSKRQLERLFRQFLNTSPNQYLRELQLSRAARMLTESSGTSIQAVAEQCGFADSNYFSKCFKQRYLVSPRTYRANVTP